MFLASIALATTMALAVVGIGRRRGRMVRTLLAALGAAAAVWVIGLAVILSEWRDTDGFVDCNQHCDGRHWLGGLWFFAPPLFAVEVAVLAGLAAISGRGSRG